MKRQVGWTSDDWYQPGEGQLHFFMRQKRLLWVVGRDIKATAEAWGGEKPVPGVDYGTMKPDMTHPGTYVVSGCTPYTTNTWKYSRIPWGTPVKLGPHRKYVLYQKNPGQGAWERLYLDAKEVEELVRWFASTFDPVRRQIYDANQDGFPDTWIFNDFGPWAVRYFADPNRNRKLDAGEKLRGEMIHTTPQEEADKAMNRPTQMESSHGCIHVKPVDRDKLLGLGAFEPGVLLAVHGPSEVVPEILSGQ